MAKRRDYGYVRSYASLGSDVDDLQRLLARGYGGALFDYNDPQLDQAIRDARAHGIPFGIWGDPNAVGNNAAAYVARMQRLNQQYNPDLFALDLENHYKGDPGSAESNRMLEMARLWQQAMPGVRTAITPLGSEHSMYNWNVNAWGPDTEWMPQAYGADSHTEAFDAQKIVQNLIAAGVRPENISPILADAHYNTGRGGYGGSALWTLDDFIGRDLPLASNRAPQVQATGGPVAPPRTIQSTGPGRGGPKRPPRGPLEFFGQGYSQSAPMVQKRGLQWYGQNFKNKQQFTKALKQRGKTYSQWAAQHQPAASALNQRQQRVR